MSKKPSVNKITSVAVILSFATISHLRALSQSNATIFCLSIPSSAICNLTSAYTMKKSDHKRSGSQ